MLFSMIQRTSLVVRTMNNLIHIVCKIHSSACFVTRRVITRFILCVDAFVVWTVHVKTVRGVCAAPTFTIKLNPKVNIAFVITCYCTPANKTRGNKRTKIVLKVYTYTPIDQVPVFQCHNTWLRQLCENNTNIISFT